MNNTADRPIIVRDILARSAGLFADSAAYLVKDGIDAGYRPITYRDAWAEMNAIGAAMTRRGLKGKKVALLGENCYQWISVYLACASGNIVGVPLGTELGADAIKNLTSIADCEAIFYTSRFDDIVGELDINLKVKIKRYASEESDPAILTYDDLLKEGKALPESEIEDYRTQKIDKDAMSLLMFTSGTTGNAKGVMLSTSHIAHSVWDMEQAHDIKPGDVTVSILPIYHIFEAVMGQQFMYGHGCTVAFGDGIKYLKKNMAEVGANVQLLVPLIVENFYKSVWRNAKKKGREADLKERIEKYKKLRSDLIKEKGIDGDSEARKLARDIFREEQSELGGKLDIIFTGAAAIDPKFIIGLHDIGLKITQGYGMTEAGPLVSATPYHSDTRDSAGSVGPVTPSGEIKIFDPDEDGVGEVLYKSPSVMLGYLDMPEQTEAVLRDGWYHTGDFGFLDERGWLYITGRKNNIIVTKTGKNIYPEELENDLAKNQYIGELMVYGGEDMLRGGIAVSVQVRPDYDRVAADGLSAEAGAVYALINSIIKEYNATLPNYKRIRNVYIRDTEFVKTATGKLMRRASIDTFSE